MNGRLYGVNRNESFWGILGRSIWNYQGLAAIFTAGLLLLFIDKVPTVIAEHLLPALIISGLGFIMIGYVEGSIYRKHFNQQEDEKTKHPYLILFAANIAWYIILIIYLFWRGVL